jgi:hypothetical protein
MGGGDSREHSDTLEARCCGVRRGKLHAQAVGFVRRSQRVLQVEDWPSRPRAGFHLASWIREAVLCVALRCVVLCLHKRAMSWEGRKAEGPVEKD